MLGFDGSRYVAPDAGDDAGIYYFVPLLSRVLHLPLERSVDWFFSAILITALVGGAIGYFYLLRDNLTRILAIVTLVLVALLGFHYSDIYIVSAALPCALVPWVVFYTSGQKSSLAKIVAFFLCGLLSGLANTIRIHSGTAMLIFILFYWIFEHASLNTKKTKLVLCCVLIAGFLVPQLYFRYLLNRRDAYLLKTESHSMVSGYHAFWHSTYIGLGFLENPYVPRYQDEVAFTRAQVLAPGVRLLSPEYEKVLRQEVLRLLREHPGFFAMSMFAKCGVIEALVLPLALLGVLSMFFNKRTSAGLVAFVLSIGFSCLPGILVVPSPRYIFGAIAFAMLFSVAGFAQIRGPAGQRTAIYGT